MLARRLISCSTRYYNQLVNLRCIHSSLAMFGVKGQEVRMPSLSPTMTEGTIIQWLKKEGETISPGDVVCEIQTDKAVVGFEMEEEGILAKILVPENTKDVKIGTLIALMVEEGEDWKDVEIPAETSAPSAGGAAPASAPSPAAPATESKPTMTEIKDKLKTMKMGPSVRNLIQQYNLDADDIKASGPHGTLLKGDVLQFIQSRNLKPAPQTAEPPTSQPQAAAARKAKQGPGGQRYIDIEITNMRRVIAKRLTQSKTTIPHAYMGVSCNLNGIINQRKVLKSQGVAVSINDFIIKAAAIALKKVPQINASWDEAQERVNYLPNVDISVAVATPNGLITPIVKNANRLQVDEISKTVKELAGRAREGKLKPEEFQGGSFSISNLGMFGITEFEAVINPPQAAILAVGTSRPILSPDGEIQQNMIANLSYDSRVADEEVFARFLEVFKEVIENPEQLESDGEENRRLAALIS